MASTRVPALPIALIPPGRDARRTRWRRRSVTLGVVVLLVLPPIGWVAVARGGAPSDGVFTYPSDPAWSAAEGVGVMQVVRDDGDTVGEPPCVLRQPRPGSDPDRVVAVDDVPLDDWVSGRADGRRPTIDDALEYTVVRGDGSGRCEVFVTLTRTPWTAMLEAHAVVLVLAGVMWAMGTFMVMQRPREPAVRALFVLAVVLPYGVTAWPVSAQVVDLTQGPRLWPFAWGEVANMLVWGGVLHFAAVFPRPVPLLRRRPWLLGACYAFPFVLHVGRVAVLEPRLLWPELLTIHAPSIPPRSGLTDLAVLLPASTPAAYTVPALATATVIRQYRSTEEPDERRRMRWVIYAFLLAAAAYLLLGQLPERFLGYELVPWWAQVLLLTTVPVAVAAAVLRYGLLDLQVILRRSFVYGALTVALVVGPALVTSGALAVLAPVEEERLDGLHRLLIVWLVVSALLLTLRDPLKRRLSRLAFGARDDPFELVSQLSGRLHAAAPAQSVLTSVAETVARALRLPYVGIEITSPDGVVDTESHGRREGEVLALPLVDQGEEVGRLLLDVGARREPFGPADRRLIELLTQQVGLAARSVLLTARLQRSLQRAVVAREEERRRLRRDIHDGVGPMLAASKLQLELARRSATTHPAAVTPILDDLVEIQRTVMDDIRRLVEGLRPPVLDQLGLVGAVRAHAVALSTTADDGAGLTVTVDATAVEPLPAAVEVAAYRILLEAMTNVARHAGAVTCRVRLWRPTPEALLLEVEDDGRGLPDVYRAGVGLNSMRERATELGGAFSIAARTPHGTVVRARLPIPVSDAGDGPEE